MVSSEQTADLDDVNEGMLEQAEFWNDATDEGSLDEVKDITDSLLADLDVLGYSIHSGEQPC